MQVEIFRSFPALTGHRFRQENARPWQTVTIEQFATPWLNSPSDTMNLRNSLKTLLVFVLGLPVLLAVLEWVAGLVTAMGDEATATVLGHISTAARVIWLVCLVGAVVVLALQSLEITREE